jgi:hypothetical protein
METGKPSGSVENDTEDIEVEYNELEFEAAETKALIIYQDTQKDNDNGDHSKITADAESYKTFFKMGSVIDSESILTFEKAKTDITT